MRSADHDSGSVTVFVVGIMSALIVMSGLVFDGGNILAGHREADAEAEGAARAGAQQVAPHALHAGRVEIDPITVQKSVDAYLAPYHHRGVVAFSGDVVKVTVTFVVTMQILSIVGVQSRTVTGTGTATALEGTDAGQ